MSAADEAATSRAKFLEVLQENEELRKDLAATRKELDRVNKIVEKATKPHEEAIQAVKARRRRGKAGPTRERAKA